MGTTALAGRSGERAVTANTLSTAVAGRGSLVAITGEAGIGKTTLVSAVAADAIAQGFAVARGNCDQSGGAPAYWPWTEVLRSIAVWLPGEDLDVALGPRRTRLAALAPDLAGDRSAPASDAGDAPDSESDRFLLFDAAMAALAAAAKRFPLLVVVEDVHVADLPSVALLDFVARRVAGHRIVVVITYRDVEARLDAALDRLLDPITATATHLNLTGLEREAIAELVGDEHGARAHELSGGNPLIAQEVARSLASGQGRWAATGSLRAIVARRLELLTPETRELVVWAAVLGMDFELAAVTDLTNSDTGHALQRLAEAMRAGVVAETEFPAAGHRFRHALIRDAVYEALDPADAARRHAAVAARIRATSGDPAALAHHSLRAALVDGWEPAVAAAWAAANASLSVLAAEDAARVLGDALALVPAGEVATRLELLLELGAAAGIALQEDRASAAFAEAERLARGLGDVKALAEVALRGGWVPMRLFGITGTPDAGQIGLLEEVLERLPAAETVLRIKIMTRLAAQIRWVPGLDTRRAQLTAEAAGLARDLDDPALLARALMVQYTTTVLPPHAADAVATEAIEAFRRCAAPAERGQAEIMRFTHALNHGDLATCRVSAGAFLAICDRYEPSERWLALCFLLSAPLIEGRLSDAEGLLSEIVAAAEAVGGSALERSRVVVESLRAMIARRRGGTDVYRQLGELGQAFAAVLPGMSAWLPAAALCFCWTGDDAGKRLFREILADLDNLTRETQWLGTMMILADGCAFTGAVEHAPRLHQLLLPYEGWQGTIAMTDSYGPIDRSLGTLETLMGRFDDAEQHFQLALAADRRMRARSSSMQTMLEFGRMLAMRGGSGDEQRITELVHEIQAAAEFVGTADIDMMCERYGLVPRHAVGGGTPRDPDPATALLRKDGELWELSFGRSSSRLRDSKGLQQLVRLLAEPGREFHVLDLSSPAGTDRERAEVAATAGSAGPVLDAQAKAAYRRRVEELQDDIDDAEACADLERAGRAREELQVYLSELSGALGLGGRDRPAGSPAERARVAVTKTLRTAIDRIAAAEPALGAHLRSAVSTGIFCAYAPDPSAAIRVTVDAEGPTFTA